MYQIAAQIPQTRRKSLPGSYRTLVLNAGYQPLSTYPLSIISAQDAVSAMWRERVGVVETWQDAFFRSPSMAIAVPKVVTLRQFAPVAGEPKFYRRSILLRDRFRCQYCGESSPVSRRQDGLGRTSLPPVSGATQPTRTIPPAADGGH